MFDKIGTTSDNGLVASLFGRLGDVSDDGKAAEEITIFGKINKIDALIGTKDSSTLDEMFGRIGSTSV